jgi:hypothetical protein
MHRTKSNLSSSAAMADAHGAEACPDAMNSIELRLLWFHDLHPNATRKREQAVGEGDLVRLATRSLNSVHGGPSTSEEEIEKCSLRLDFPTRARQRR